MRFRPSCLLLPLLCCAAPLSHAQGLVASEAALQAALLYNFVIYTDWPALPAQKIEICVMGSPALHESLSNLQHRKIKGLALEVKTVATNAQLRSCQVLFVGPQDHQRIHEISQVTRSTAMLLVAEENGFDANDVIISLRRQEGRYTFKINQTQAKARSLELSARLLKLAALVY